MYIHKFITFENILHSLPAALASRHAQTSVHIYIYMYINIHIHKRIYLYTICTYVNSSRLRTYYIIYQLLSRVAMPKQIRIQMDKALRMVTLQGEGSPSKTVTPSKTL